MLPLAALFVAFFVAPLIVLLALSLNADTATATWTAANYVKFFTDRFNYSILWDTLFLGVKATLVCLVFAIRSRGFARARARAGRACSSFSSSCPFSPAWWCARSHGS